MKTFLSTLNFDRRLIVIFLAVVSIQSKAGEKLAPYRITSLGEVTDRLSINSIGWVAGRRDGHPFVWSSSTGFNDLSIPDGRDYLSVSVIDINDSNDVLMSAIYRKGDLHWNEGLVWSESRGYVTMPVLLDEEKILSCNGNSMNNLGGIVGWCYRYTRKGGEEDIPISGSIDAVERLTAKRYRHWDMRKIADSGAILYVDYSGRSASTLLRDGMEISIPILSYSMSGDGLIVVGEEKGAGTTAAVWTEAEGVIILGQLPHGKSKFTSATVANNVGEVAGWVYKKDYSETAFVWTRADGMRDIVDLIDPLDPLKSEFIEPIINDINDLGWIVGSYIRGGQRIGFILKPAIP